MVPGVHCTDVLPEHRQKQRDQSESRASAQRGELSAVLQTHQQGEVERQLLEQESAHLSEALARVREGCVCSHFRLSASFSWCFCVRCHPDLSQVSPAGCKHQQRAVAASEQAAV